MAVLNKIRQRSLFLILIIALALFAFVLADLFKNSDALTAKSQNVIATVNGKEITREAFLQKVEIAQRQAGPSATNTQVMNRVWEQEVRQAIMETQFEELGITVEKDQMRDLLRTSLATSPEFLNEAGLFDENKLNEYIANLKETSPAGFESWVNYEKQIASNALNQNYYNMVKAGLVGTLAEGELEHNLEGNKVDLKYVQIAYSTISDSLVKVSKSDISDYINEHKNQFEVEASRDIRFVEFKEEASIEDEKSIKAELNRYKKGQLVDADGRKNVITAFSEATDNEDYINSVAASDIKFNDNFVFKGGLTSEFADDIFNLNEGEVYGPYKEAGFFKISKVIAVKQIPDSAKVRHILIPHLGAQSATPEVTKTQEQAKTLADSLLTVLKTDRSKFSEFVTEYSSDQGSVTNEGRYDWHPYNSMVPEFNDFEFGGEVGDLGVVKTVFGFHIIEIEGLTDPKKAVQVGTIARRIEPSEATTDKVFRDASNFEINAGEGDFEAVAKENKFTVRPVNGIKVLDESIPGVGNQRPIVRWAFEEQVEVGDIKRFNIPGGYVIAQVVAQNEAGLMSVDDATATVLPILRKEKKAEMIKDRISVESLEDIAAAEKTTVKAATGVNMKNPTISGAGREPYVVGAAFGLNEGETSGLLEGVKGVYAVQVTKVTPAVKLDNYQAAANRVEQQKTGIVNSRLYNALKESAEIEDNRAATQIQ
ncbi:SurA N-terminal domain-containing protein [Tamlana sp. 2_MG-2023]|uniref:peptidylprolyl isomerase n=1 Tax=unclassified Tamlana TaxID=2614803 RepID=UPI0026E2CBA6|nr:MULTISPECIES: SurA N-terminal domain-containing protein [unclassified Tamlana]MDO6760360.1 SurA N-terminal domain-containing protein [Tamlana sp. 2_MG-2023]MDO6789942.1 SurA N-terminal domain-containing protein [Tamlana sp. 1_MG-2023]